MLCLRPSRASSDPLGGVKNLQVTDPTISTLTVKWDPAVGNVRSYKVFYAAQPGGEERMVKDTLIPWCWCSCGGLDLVQ